MTVQTDTWKSLTLFNEQGFSWNEIPKDIKTPLLSLKQQIGRLQKLKEKDVDLYLERLSLLREKDDQVVSQLSELIQKENTLIEETNVNEPLVSTEEVAEILEEVEETKTPEKEVPTETTAQPSNHIPTPVELVKEIPEAVKQATKEEEKKLEKPLSIEKILPKNEMVLHKALANKNDRFTTEQLKAIGISITSSRQIELTYFVLKKGKFDRFWRIYPRQNYIALTQSPQKDHKSSAIPKYFDQAHSRISNVDLQELKPRNTDQDSLALLAKKGITKAIDIDLLKRVRFNVDYNSKLSKIGCKIAQFELVPIEENSRVFDLIVHEEQ